MVTFCPTSPLFLEMKHAISTKLDNESKFEVAATFLTNAHFPHNLYDCLSHYLSEYSRAHKMSCMVDTPNSDNLLFLTHRVLYSCEVSHMQPSFCNVGKAMKNYTSSVVMQKIS